MAQSDDKAEVIMQRQALQVRKLRIGEEGALFDFLDCVYASQPAKRSRSSWDWQYRQNPLASSDEYSIWTCWDGDQIVGQRPLMPFQLWIDGGAIPAVWAPDFMIRPEYRGQGIGTLLMRRLLEEKPIFIALDSSIGALRIYEKLGCSRLPDVIRFTYLHQAGQFMQRQMRWRWVANLLTPLANRVLAARRFMLRGAESDNFDIVKLGQFDDRFDDLWHRARPHHVLLACRTADLLTWRYAQAPGTMYRVLAVADANTLIGYLVWQMLPTGRALICDLYSANLAPEVMEALIQSVLRDTAILGIEGVECYAKWDTLKRVLNGCGFSARSGKSFVVHPGRSGIKMGRLAHSSDWYITALDSDIDPIFH